MSEVNGVDDRARWRWWSAALVCVFAVMASVASFAQAPGGDGADYQIDSSDWNGLSKLVQMAKEQGIELQTEQSVDYDELSPDQPLLIVYPGQELDVSSLGPYVVDGGRMLMADDFGQGDALLERLDIQRERVTAGALPHDTFLEDNPGLPVFRPTGVHPLLEDVEAIVANHPAVLHHQGGPVVSFAGRSGNAAGASAGGLAFDMNLGEGKVVVVGDASVLINQMLEVADNRKFVQNALQYLCEGISPCRPHLLVGEFRQTGDYASDGDDRDEVWNDVSDAIEAFNEAVASTMEKIPTSPLLYYLAILLAAGLALYLATVFSVTRPRPYSRYIAEATDGVPTPQTEFEWNVARFDSADKDTNFALPLAILKEIFEEMFLRELGLWPIRGSERPTVVELANRFSDEYLQEMTPKERARIEEDLRELLATFARIPTRHRVFLDSDAYFSERDLIQLYRRAMHILEIMNLEEEYERRTRSLV